MNLIHKIEKILLEGGIEEYKQEAKLLVLGLSGLKIEEILFETPIDNEDEIFEAAKLRVQKKLPIQHILGFSYFMNSKYLVNKDVLIPRDETEILIRHCFELLKEKQDKIDVLDIGVGSGCISCELAKLLNTKDIEILGVDISTGAIEVALENVNRQDLVRKVILRKSDLFSKIRENEKFDLIVSNPPYIPAKEKNNLQYELRFEPESALFASDDEGVEFYKKIIIEAPKYLKKDGFAAFELGINQAPQVKKMLQKDFKDIQIIKDLADIERVICAKLK